MKRAVALLFIVLLGGLCLASAARELSGDGENQVVAKVADISHAVAGEQLEVASSRQLKLFWWKRGWFWPRRWYYNNYYYYYGYYPGYGYGYYNWYNNNYYFCCSTWSGVYDYHNSYWGKK